LHDAGMKALAAIDKKDADALSDAGETIDEACEQCHLKYWYPPNTPDILKNGSVRKTS
jgi:cytochrome c556